MQASASGVSVPPSVLAGFPRLRALCPAEGEGGRRWGELISAVLQDPQASSPPRCAPDTSGAFRGVPLAPSRALLLVTALSAGGGG